MPAIKPNIAENKFIQGFNRKILDSKLLNKMYKFASEDTASFASRTALISALTKDAFGCYYYVTQSLNNDRIPEDKRGFLASLDFMNGVLNVGIQLTIGLWIDKHSKEWFDKLPIGKALEKINTEKIAKAITPMVNGKSEKESDKVNFEQVDKFLREKLTGIGKQEGGAAKWLKVGYSAAIMLIATQVVIKRMIVPFIATPSAGWVKKKFLDKDKPKTEHDRIYYDWLASSTGRYDNKMDKTAFSNFNNNKNN